MQEYIIGIFGRGAKFRNVEFVVELMIVGKQGERGEAKIRYKIQTDKTKRGC
jgi:hypothetical protein